MDIQYTAPVGGGLYLIRLSETDFYGGRTCDFKSRWRMHLAALINNRHKNKRMQEKFNTNHIFSPEVLEIIPTLGEQVTAEQKWLDNFWGQIGCVNLSRCAIGSMQGRKHTEEAKEKMRARIWSLEARCRAAEKQRGKRASPETREKMSEAGKGRKLSPEQIQILTACNRNRVWTIVSRKRLSESHLGHVRSEESRAKQSATLRASPDLREKARAALAINSKLITPEAILKRNRATGLKLMGRRLSPETIKKIVAIHRGRRNTEETKRLMSESAKARSIAMPTKHDEETRALISSQQKGRVWINNGTENRKVYPSETSKLIEQGWVLGRSGRAVVEAPVKRPKEEIAAEISVHQRGRIWINNGVKNRKVFEPEIPELLIEGWVLGSIQRRPNHFKGIWVCREGETQMIQKEELQSFLDTGWLRGRSTGERLTSANVT